MLVIFTSRKERKDRQENKSFAGFAFSARGKFFLELVTACLKQKAQANKTGSGFKPI
jgi:hypothetical protein